MGWVYGIYAAVAGLLIGSFLNVCICRIPKKETIVTGRSHCMSCGAPIKWYDLVPVVSFLVLRGRCRSCGRRISPRYPAVELLNAALYLLLYLSRGLTLALLPLAAGVSALIVAGMIDFDTGEIPNGVSIFLLAAGTAALVLDGSVPVAARLLGLLAASVPLLIAAAASRGGMGLGDVKLAGAAGLVAGWQGSLLALLLASVTGAIAACALVLLKKRTFKSSIAFGPFLAAGFIFSILYGAPLLRWYFSLDPPV